MTAPVTLKSGSQFQIKLETAPGSGVYEAPCGFTTKSFKQTKSVNESVIPDCDDPDAPAYVERDVDSLSSEITGSGFLATEDLADWQAFFASTDSLNVRFYYGSLGTYAGYYQGAYHLTDMSNVGDRGKKVTMDITLQSDGAWTWTATPS